MTSQLVSGIFFSALLTFFSKFDLSLSYLVFKANPLISILFTFATSLSYIVFLTTSFFSVDLLKSTGTDTNLSIFNLSISAFKLVESDFAASLNVSIPVALFKSVFVV